MAPPRQVNRQKPPTTKPKQRPREARQPTSNQTSIHKPASDASDATESSSGIDLSATIPLSLQQLLLDVFKTALLSPSPPRPNPNSTTKPPETSSTDPDPKKSSAASENTSDEAPLDTKSLIQTIKAHLYQRDFDSAFTDAGEDLLRAYALRWSAARALGYAGLLKAVLTWMLRLGENGGAGPDTRVVCIGGGAGAEIVALAAAWRDLEVGSKSLEQGVAGVSLEENEADTEARTAPEISTAEEGEDEGDTPAVGPSRIHPRFSVAAVDIADWSAVVDRLARTISSSDVPTPSTSKYQPPLLPAAANTTTTTEDRTDFSVLFHRADILSLPEPDLKNILIDTSSTPNSPALLVTLMFTLNELFSTSMPKATGLLLRLTELLPPGAVLLVVDSPGSYSTLKLGKGKDGAAQERKYPMKFLLDHTLLSVAEGRWERVFTQDSRWWRRDAARLRYEVGEGAGLEDMRFQVHVYRRLE
ncbi:hypothetical protein NUU61_006368 [Penicillium alfredii]|uniref:25S rRNA (Uridine(2843)-N(3))-methyltransferase n=1 Tax=Penicillium alfredii TaxID=1506179 RepID=A0A9W9K3A0_9EURO|nr:uncharacterized protein NUU61_006368 [Penicillium alfredii]KAJ5091498.1 hypothetical protein NUU61_006368 [Penicillium alfredii]